MLPSGTLSSAWGRTQVDRDACAAPASAEPRGVVSDV